MVGLPLLTAVLAAAGSDAITLATDLLLFLVATVGIAVLGGVLVGTVAAVLAVPAGQLVLRRADPHPGLRPRERRRHRDLRDGRDRSASVLVDRIRRRSQEAFQARAEAGALARTSGILIGASDPLPELLDQLRTTFALQSVSLLSNRDDGWVLDASAGDDPPTDPYHGDSWDLVEDGTSVVVLRGAQLSSDDQRVLRTFLSNLALALESRRLQSEAAVAAHMAEADQLRTALLQAVSHDLRTPLASIKASASSLLQSDVGWDAEQLRAFAQTIDSAADRLNHLVGDLLDMSRVQAGALSANVRPVFLEDVVAAALASIDHRPEQVEIDVPDSLPLSTRTPPCSSGRSRTSSSTRSPGPRERARCGWRRRSSAIGCTFASIDRGPGVDRVDRERIFQPFQRLGDHDSQGGVGLGLAVAARLRRSRRRQHRPRRHAGGGLTVLIDLPVAATSDL